MSRTLRSQNRAAALLGVVALLLLSIHCGTGEHDPKFGQGGSGNSTAPAISGVSPITGSLAGGTTVVIAGANFSAGATVTFGTTNSSSVTVVNAAQINAVSPARSAGVV